MKHCLAKLFFVLCVFFSISCAADCNCSNGEMSFVPCPKTYVHPDQIELYGDAIFVKVNDNIIQTENLHTDAEGIFFAKAAIGDKCSFLQWKCKRKDKSGMRCDTCNWNWKKTCSSCGGDISESWLIDEFGE